MFPPSRSMARVSRRRSESASSGKSRSSLRACERLAAESLHRPSVPKSIRSEDEAEIYEQLVVRSKLLRNACWRRLETIIVEEKKKNEISKRGFGNSLSF